MKHLRLCSIVFVALFAIGWATDSAASGVKPPAKPADLKIEVQPERLDPGDLARITVRIEPIAGVKINRYPKIKLLVQAQDGLVQESKVEIGDSSPPPPEKLETNYYKTVDPVELDLQLDAKAQKGKHTVEAKLTYFYCVTKSGFCAPARVPLEIPIVID